MTEDKFRDFLIKHRALGYKYKDAGLAGLINVWFYENKFVLTWEECRDGDQFNESNYTRDDRYELPDVNSVVELLHESGVDITHFKP